MMNNTINNEINDMMHFLEEQLPNWQEATADMLLDALSKSDNQQIKETAEFVKVSKKSPEMKMVLDFAISMIRNNPIPIRERIYDEGMDGIYEMHQHFIDKYGNNQNEKRIASTQNCFWWLIYRIPGKIELIKKRLIY